MFVYIKVIYLLHYFTVFYVLITLSSVATPAGPRNNFSSMYEKTV